MRLSCDFCVALIACSFLLLAAVPTARSENSEVHEWSIWFADPLVKNVNDRDRCLSALPSQTRSTRRTSLDNGKDGPRPVAMTTFYGAPADDFEVEIRVPQGRHLESWPAAQFQNGRIRWLDRTLGKDLNSARRPELTDGSLISAVRSLPGLYIAQQGEAERSLSYDVELSWEIPLELTGGPEKYEVVNRDAHTLRSVAIADRSGTTGRIAWLDELAPASGREGVALRGPETESPADPPPADPTNPVAGVERATRNVIGQFTKSLFGSRAADTNVTSFEVVMGEPVDLASAEWRERGRDALQAKLRAAGLTDEEASLVIGQYGKALFDEHGIRLIYFLPSQVLDVWQQPTFYPEPSRLTRVGLVVVTDVDPHHPETIAQLITQLGNPVYAERVAAGERLKQLGKLAVPALRKALAEKDLEIVMRSERILMALGETVD